MWRPARQRFHAGLRIEVQLELHQPQRCRRGIWQRFDVPWQPAYLFEKPDGSSTFVNNPTSAMSQQELSDRVAALTK